MRLTIKATCPMNLANFPMDDQMCTVMIKKNGRPNVHGDGHAGVDVDGGDDDRHCDINDKDGDDLIWLH